MSPHQALIKVEFRNARCVLKSQWAVISNDMIEQTPYNVNKSKTGYRIQDTVYFTISFLRKLNVVYNASLDKTFN